MRIASKFKRGMESVLTDGKDVLTVQKLVISTRELLVTTVVPADEGVSTAGFSL